jgi:hypothetical protein
MDDLKPDWGALARAAGFKKRGPYKRSTPEERAARLQARLVKIQGRLGEAGVQRAAFRHNRLRRNRRKMTAAEIQQDLDYLRWLGTEGWPLTKATAARIAALETRLARLQPVTCPTCGETFVRGRADQVYCSARCRQRAFRATVATDVRLPGADGSRWS